MSSAVVTELLDATDTVQRFRQNALLLASMLLVLASVAMVTTGVLSHQSSLVGPGLGSLALAALFLRLASRAMQRWELTHKGHRIRFENSALFGEKLFIDDVRVATGGFGWNLRLQGVISSGDGAGEQIVACVEARISSFRCRIEARSPS